MATINARLAALEVKRTGPVQRVCCVQFGDGPQTKPDGSICLIDHDKVITLGGDAIHVVWRDAVTVVET